MNSIYALLLPALKEVWLRELEFKMGLNPGFDCTFTSVFGTGEQGVSPNGYRYHCFSKQDSLANGRVILAECYPHWWRKPQNFKYKTVRLFLHKCREKEKIGWELKYKHSPKLHFWNCWVSLLQRKRDILTLDFRIFLFLP